MSIKRSLLKKRSILLTHQENQDRLIQGCRMIPYYDQSTLSGLKVLVRDQSDKTAWSCLLLQWMEHP